MLVSCGAAVDGMTHHDASKLTCYSGGEIVFSAANSYVEPTGYGAWRVVELNHNGTYKEVSGRRMEYFVTGSDVCYSEPIIPNKDEK